MTIWPPTKLHDGAGHRPEELNGVVEVKMEKEMSNKDVQCIR
jgi:hypothetical protein